MNTLKKIFATCASMAIGISFVLPIANFADSQSAGFVTGLISYGPVRNTGTTCVPSPYTTISFTNTQGNTRLVPTDRGGRYFIWLPAGTYTMKFPVTASSSISLHPVTKTVYVRPYVATQEGGCWDTGIR